MAKSNEWRAGRVAGMFGEDIPSNPSQDFRKGYAVSAKRSYWRAVISGIVVSALPLISGLVAIDSYRAQQSRGQRIVQFYQENGVCPNDATPEYLDLRTRLWQRNVEQNKLTE